jgi:hypothetical protein
MYPTLRKIYDHWKKTGKGYNEKWMNRKDLEQLQTLEKYGFIYSRVYKRYRYWFLTDLGKRFVTGKTRRRLKKTTLTEWFGE